MKRKLFQHTAVGFSTKMKRYISGVQSFAHAPLFSARSIWHVSAHVVAGSLRFASVRKEDELDNKYYQCNQYNPALKVKAGGSLKALSVTGPGNVP